MGFPHPSGANVNRLIQLETNKEKTLIICRQFQKKFLILLLNNQNWIKINPT